MFNRTFAMPSGDTFSVPPIGAFVRKYARGVIVDPFARNTTHATHSNDINPETSAHLHMDAEDACRVWHEQGVKADVAIFDPPYSPRQITEVYQAAGLKVGMKETQSGAMYRRVRNALDLIMKPGGVVLSFGWSSNGMGLKRGYEIEEILLVCHGGAHNDTICMAERKLQGSLFGAQA